MLLFKARPRKDPTESPYLTNSQRRVIAALGSAMRDVRAAVEANEGQILDAILHGPPSRLLAVLPEEPWAEAQEVIQEELASELVAAGRRYGQQVPSVQKATVNFAFDEARPEAAAWAAKEAGQLIVEVVEEQRTIVRGLAQSASMGEMTPRDAARSIRDVIGLTNRQAGWVQNYRRRQVAALEAEGLSPAQVTERADRLTQRYHDRIHRYRSENIARTEILTASHEGRRQAWQQGLDEGYIAPNSQKQWSANLDGRVCDECSALDGTVVPLDGPFPQGDPPLHPSCRCDVLLLPAQPQGIEELQGLTDAELDQQIQTLVNPPSAGGLDPSITRWIDPNDLDVQELAVYQDEVAQQFDDVWRESVGIPDAQIRTRTAKNKQGDIIVQTEVSTAEGEHVLQATRRINARDRAVEHLLFEVEPSYQGTGIATRANARFFDLYRSRGIERVELQANIDVGGYTWAKQGFDWDLDKPNWSVDTARKGIRSLTARALSEAEKLGADSPLARQARALDARLAGDPLQWPTPLEIAMLGWEEGSEMWIGKELMLGSSWLGKLQL